MKQGQGLSMETIVLAILALIVLIVLILIFTGKAGQFNKQSQSCIGKGGECISTTDVCSVPGILYTCDQPQQRCCLSR